ncbi:MAG: UDP-N-acetylglucosamine 2-epimerase [bacterium]|nr:UDP-N-acetylglucosamine 2-epimerase [bacterium]
MPHKKKIAYVTGTRADFGLMTPVLHAIEASRTLSLDLYATGMHLMPEHGNTLRQVKRLFSSVKRIDAVYGEKEQGMAEFSAALLPRVVSAFGKKRPDFVLLLGDRAEMFVVALACLYLRIPTGHLHGGEKTETVDEVARHAITKMASLHFPATKESAQRIARMGEEPSRIHVVGAPALDVILNSRIPSEREVARYLNIKAGSDFVLLLMHPAQNSKRAGAEMREALAAVKDSGLPVVVLYPNADSGSSRIIAEIEKEKGNKNFRIFKSIPHEMFLALEREAAVWVGNSSAALIESASFRTPVVNIGGRQQGRLRGKNIIDVPHNKNRIVAAIRRSLYDTRYKASLQKISNPWGDGRTGEKVRKALEHLDAPEKLLHKQIAY